MLCIPGSICCPSGSCCCNEPAPAGCCCCCVLGGVGTMPCNQAAAGLVGARGGVPAAGCMACTPACCCRVCGSCKVPAGNAELEARLLLLLLLVVVVVGSPAAVAPGGSFSVMVCDSRPARQRCSGKMQHKLVTMPVLARMLYTVIYFTADLSAWPGLCTGLAWPGLCTACHASEPGPLRACCTPCLLILCNTPTIPAGSWQLADPSRF
jgi:hypothetical protein